MIISLKHIIIILCFFVFASIEAQLIQTDNQGIINTNSFACSPPSVSYDELSNEEYFFIKNKIKYNCDSLNLNFSINNLKPNAHPLFIWPLKTKEGFSNPG